MRNRREGGAVMAVDDQARDLVALIGNHGLAEERDKRQVGKRILCGDAFLAGVRRYARKPVAAARRRGFSQQCLEIGKTVTARSDRYAVHRDDPRTGWAQLYA